MNQLLQDLIGDPGVALEHGKLYRLGIDGDILEDD